VCSLPITRRLRSPQHKEIVPRPGTIPNEKLNPHERYSVGRASDADRISAVKNAKSAARKVVQKQLLKRVRVYATLRNPEDIRSIAITTFRHRLRFSSTRQARPHY
jgi:hypothetical protein